VGENDDTDHDAEQEQSVRHANLRRLTAQV
jgi:hypothetical protein